MPHLPARLYLLRPERREGPRERTHQQVATESLGVLSDRGQVTYSSLQVEAFQKSGGHSAESGARDANSETSFVP